MLTRPWCLEVVWLSSRAGLGDPELTFELSYCCCWVYSVLLCWSCWLCCVWEWREKSTLVATLLLFCCCLMVGLWLSVLAMWDMILFDLNLRSFFESLPERMYGSNSLADAIAFCYLFVARRWNWVYAYVALDSVFLAATSAMILCFDLGVRSSSVCWGSALFVFAMWWCTEPAELSMLTISSN